MLHTKFHGNRPTSSGEEGFEGFLPYLGVATILVICLRPREQNFVPLHIKFQLVRPNGLKQKKIFEIVDDDGRRTDRRTSDHGHPITHLMSLRLR